MQGGCDAKGRNAKGKYGTKHFPGVDKFPSGHLRMSQIAKEFGIANTKTTHSKEELIAWLYHRIRTIRKKFITDPQTGIRYEQSTLGLAGRATRDKPRLDTANASHKEWLTTNTDTGKRRRSSSSPALDRTSPFQPASSTNAKDDVSAASLREAETDELSRVASNEILKITDKPTKGYRLRTRPDTAASSARADSDEMSEGEQDSSEEGDSEFATSSEDQEHEEHDSDVELSPQML